jgi:hypothetical protein
MEAWPGRIAWAEDGRGGLSFDRPMHEAVVARYTGL